MLLYFAIFAAGFLAGNAITYLWEKHKNKVLDEIKDTANDAVKKAEQILEELKNKE